MTYHPRDVSLTSGIFHTLSDFGSKSIPGITISCVDSKRPCTENQKVKAGFTLVFSATDMTPFQTGKAIG